jgi:hypothetical protein
VLVDLRAASAGAHDGARVAHDAAALDRELVALAELGRERDRRGGAAGAVALAVGAGADVAAPAALGRTEREDGGQDRQAVHCVRQRSTSRRVAPARCGSYSAGGSAPAKDGVGDHPRRRRADRDPPRAVAGTDVRRVVEAPDERQASGDCGRGQARARVVGPGRRSARRAPRARVATRCASGSRVANELPSTSPTRLKCTPDAPSRSEPMSASRTCSARTPIRAVTPHSFVRPSVHAPVASRVTSAGGRRSPSSSRAPASRARRHQALRQRLRSDDPARAQADGGEAGRDERVGVACLLDELGPHARREADGSVAPRTRMPSGLAGQLDDLAVQPGGCRCRRRAVVERVLQTPLLRPLAPAATPRARPR